MYLLKPPSHCPPHPHQTGYQLRRRCNRRRGLPCRPASPDREDSHHSMCRDTPGSREEREGERRERGREGEERGGREGEREEGEERGGEREGEGEGRRG